MFELSPHGSDVFVGTGPRYPWGGLYGGQIVAQALHAASSSVEPGLEPHSIRAYFIRRGDDGQPVRYEVERIRNGRTFATRRVVARQALGAILNAESSFHTPETAVDINPIKMPEIPGPDGLENSSFTTTFDRMLVRAEDVGGPQRDGAGRVVAWMRVNSDLGDPSDAAAGVLQRCWLAYLSDDLPIASIVRSHPMEADVDELDSVFCASLDHTIWFHRPLRVDQWHVHEYSCHHFAGGRGLSMGHIFSADGEHVATVAQEALIRELRPE